ncbi:hypothetical protein GLOTRDRAFT_138489 [Gloeophyllum trabeum ATCC 11539]|uniref:F-box domain-containing protein n=1 Tax=Gloeophyllum trabeum (strain ATCC 11539 / FP-39264 / Madison 617) TaxID=670483 RepID=S7Q879_GLOTA|nr:uncharacterized protein GLOTRDRAFT_138489 [Gloeophyllum trabeum ATCC 11539]EPQ55648.1 hypothetical protein GLOTRDRAFT_138489 [Gloeophyllum trabeum ATCC 11539]
MPRMAPWRRDDARNFNLSDISDDSGTFSSPYRSTNGDPENSSESYPEASTGNPQGPDLQVEENNARWSTFPIGDLPPEILASVFAAVAINGGGLDQVSIVKLSRVCRHWRAVALDEPKFWNFVSAKHPTWSSTVLGRSGVIPLRVSLDVDDAESMDSARLVMTHFRRVKEFLVTGMSFDIDQVMAELPDEAPLLETWEMRKKLNHELPPPSTAFFGLRAPRLHHLTLRGFSCDWTSPLFKDLTKLGLHSVLSKTTPEEMLHILSMSPRLTELQLRTVFNEKERYTDLNHGYPRVDLPLLTHLFLGEHLRIPSENMTTMLEYLTFPATTSLVIYCRATRIDGFERLYQSILPVTGTDAVNIASVDLTLSGHAVRFEGKTSTDANDAHVYLALQCTQRRGSLDLASKTCAALPLAHHVEHLRIPGFILGQASRQAWVELLGCFPGVRRFEVAFMPIDLAGALCETDQDHITGTSVMLAPADLGRSTPLPILHTIVIESGEHTFKDEDMLKHLAYSLSQRRRVGLPIARLEIHDWVPPAGSQDLMAMLRKAVPDVVPAGRRVKAADIDRSFSYDD